MEKKDTITSVTYILAGSLIQSFNRIGMDWLPLILALFGLVIYFTGLNKLRLGLDDPGKGGVKLLIISAVVIIIGILAAYIPYVGSFSFVIIIIALMIQLFGFIIYSFFPLFYLLF